LFMKPELWQG